MQQMIIFGGGGKAYCVAFQDAKQAAAIREIGDAVAMGRTLVGEVPYFQPRLFERFPQVVRDGISRDGGWCS